MRKKSESIKAQTFDESFEKGGDVFDFLDVKSAKIYHPVQRIHIEIPKTLLNQLDCEASRVGVARTALIKLWIAEKLKRLAHS